MCLGRAFQIKDDILGVFGDEKQIGKSTLSDLQEAKKTILIWHAYHKSSASSKRFIEKVFEKRQLAKGDLMRTREIMLESGALDFAQKEIASLSAQAQATIKSSRIKTRYKEFLSGYCTQLLSV